MYLWETIAIISPSWSAPYLIFVSLLCHFAKVLKRVYATESRISTNQFNAIHIYYNHSHHLSMRDYCHYWCVILHIWYVPLYSAIWPRYYHVYELQKAEIVPINSLQYTFTEITVYMYKNYEKLLPLLVCHTPYLICASLFCNLAYCLRPRVPLSVPSYWQYLEGLSVS